MRRALATVDPAAIAANARVLRSAAPAALHCAVVKADGYGHGAVTAARAALGAGADWLGVATAHEARALREAGLREPPILVMGALSDEELPVALQARADVVAWEPAFAAGLPADARVHVKLDTGMGRLGTRDAAQADATAAAAGSRLVGAMTHFATADEEDPAFLREQLAAFRPWAAALRERTGPHLLRHAANSAAVLREPDAHLDLVRPGVALYGLDPANRDPAPHGLRPALRLTSWVAAVKPIAPGQSTGYGRRFVATRPSWIATVPIGYGDGWRRGLTNDADVLIGGRRHPLVGTVSMDNITVDLGPDTDVRVGDEAVLIGDGLLAEEVAIRLGTLNYEVTCGLTARVTRRTAGAA